MADVSSDETPANIQQVRVDEDVVLVEVSGEIDIDTSPVIRNLYTDGACPPVVVLDLSEVTFFSSSGLAALMELSGRMHQVGSELRVVAGSPATRRPMELTGLDRFLGLFQTRADALAAT